MKPLAYLFLIAIMSGCSAQIVELATPMMVLEVDIGLYRLENGVTVKVANAAPVNLRPGTTWRQIGTIDQGNVFDTKDQVVIVNSFDVHEAAIVVSDKNLIGFYLKAQKAFVEASPVPITLLDEG